MGINTILTVELITNIEPELKSLGICIMSSDIIKTVQGTAMSLIITTFYHFVNVLISPFHSAKCLLYCFHESMKWNKSLLPTCKDVQCGCGDTYRCDKEDVYSRKHLIVERLIQSHSQHCRVRE